jgi:hypothetical protein
MIIIDIERVTDFIMILYQKRQTWKRRGTKDKCKGVKCDTSVIIATLHAR